jgi:hypothetical protein
MKNPSTTITLLILIVLAMAWANGILQRVAAAAFGKDDSK